MIKVTLQNVKSVFDLEVLVIMHYWISFISAQFCVKRYRSH